MVNSSRILTPGLRMVSWLPCVALPLSNVLSKSRVPTAVRNNEGIMINDTLHARKIIQQIQLTITCEACKLWLLLIKSTDVITQTIKIFNIHQSTLIYKQTIYSLALLTDTFVGCLWSPITITRSSQDAVS